MDFLSVIFWLAVGSFLVWGGFWVADRGIPGRFNVPAKAIFAVLVLVAIVMLLFDRGAVGLPAIQLPRR